MQRPVTDAAAGDALLTDGGIGGPDSVFVFARHVAEGERRLFARVTAMSLRGVKQTAIVTPFGLQCGALPFTVSTLGDSSAWLGEVLGVEAAGFSAPALGWMCVGTVPVQPPLDLGFLGMNGCTGRVADIPLVEPPLQLTHPRMCGDDRPKPDESCEPVVPPDSPVERCGAPAPQRDIPDSCRDYPLRAARGVVGPAGLEPASIESQPAYPSGDTARGVGDDSTSASTVAAVAQLEAVVRAVLAAGQVALPRSVRRDLAHLLVDSAPDPAADAPPKPPRAAGSP